MHTSTTTAAPAAMAGEGGVRFQPGRLSNGHFGVFDVQLEFYVLRDVTLTFAERVASRLNRPDSWEPTAHQVVADAVRHALKTPPPGPLSHIH